MQLLGYKVLIFLLIEDALQLFNGKLNYSVILCIKESASKFIKETMTWAEARVLFPGKLWVLHLLPDVTSPFPGVPSEEFWLCPHVTEQGLYPTHTHRFKCVTLFMENLNFSKKGIKLFCHYLPTLREACILSSVSFVSDSSHTALQRLLKSFTHPQSQLF